MRILHTSDWHLGISLEHAPREEEHARFLAWLLETLARERVDVLVVAGDVFHHTQPAASATRMYFDFLRSAARIDGLRKIVVVGGNHDSPSRLDAPERVLEALGVHVVGGIWADGESWDRCLCPIPAADNAHADTPERVEAVVVAVPYVHEARLGLLTTRGTAEEVHARFADQFANLYTRLADRALERFGDVPLVATGHMTCTDPNTAIVAGDYRTDIHQVGSIGALPPDVFDPRYAYVALGHIHHARSLGGGRVRYCGTPVATKLDEAGSRRQVLLVDVEPGAEVQVRPLTVPVWRDIVHLRGPDAAILEALADLRTEAELVPYVYLEIEVDAPRHLNLKPYEDLLEEHFSPAARPRIVQARQTLVREDGTTVEASDLRPLSAMTPEEVFALIYSHHNKVAPDDTILRAFRSLLVAPDEAAPPVHVAVVEEAAVEADQEQEEDA